MSKKKIEFETLEEALAHIAELESAVADLKAEAEKDAAANAEADKTVKEALAERDEALAQMAELGEKLDILENNRGAGELIVKINKKHYKILGNRFLVKGTEHTAEQLSKNTEELQRMIKIGSGSLVEVE